MDSLGADRSPPSKIARAPFFDGRPKPHETQADNQRTHCELEGRSICDRDGLKSRPGQNQRCGKDEGEGESDHVGEFDAGNLGLAPPQSDAGYKKDAGRSDCRDFVAALGNLYNLEWVSRPVGVSGGAGAGSQLNNGGALSGVPQPSKQ